MPENTRFQVLSRATDTVEAPHLPFKTLATSPGQVTFESFPGTSFYPLCLRIRSVDKHLEMSYNLHPCLYRKSTLKWDALPHPTFRETLQKQCVFKLFSFLGHFCKVPGSPPQGARPCLPALAPGVPRRDSGPPAPVPAFPEK